MLQMLLNGSMSALSGPVIDELDLLCVAKLLKHGHMLKE